MAFWIRSEGLASSHPSIIQAIEAMMKIPNPATITRGDKFRAQDGGNDRGDRAYQTQQLHALHHPTPIVIFVSAGIKERAAKHAARPLQMEGSALQPMP
jgi:hypothetical protein